MTNGETERDGRPSPDALLDLADQERRGRLRIFLGAAPGVGKTYAMLSAAGRLRAEGADVLVGLVETHGRSETAQLLDNLELLPRRQVAYHGQMLTEFDLDAALRRRPALILVDELAHTNAPDSRHPKRYQDVQELLAAGIDVWTTLNIQHLESLSDVVSRITGIAVRETVPDTVIEKADDVVVVDITPEELIERLRDGKVYLPENARRAIDNFFKPGNLTALRELALRRTAARVDEQMVAWLRQHAIEGPWPTAERILVCVGSDDFSETVLRTASRLASGLNATWIAVNLERPGREPSDPEALKRLDRTIALAERLGAETARIAARDLPKEIIRFARRENITQIVIGKSRRGFLGRLFGRSLPEELVARASEIAVHIVAGAAAGAGTAPRPALRLPSAGRFGAGLVTAVLSVAVAVGVGMALSHLMRLPNLSMIFITAVLVSALTGGVVAAIAAAVLSFVAYNFFFISPTYTFTIAEPHELLALLIFLLVAVFTGSLTGRLREQAEAARRRVRTTEVLYDFSRKLSATAKLEDVVWAVAVQVASAAGKRAVVLLPSAGDLAVSGAWPPEDRLGAGEWAAARWALSHCEPAGWRTGTLPNSAMQFRPLVGSDGKAVGVVGVEPNDPGEGWSSEDERALAALTDQSAIAIERAKLAEEIASTRAVVEGEKLRSALLSSISHDLRTPLAAIIGAVTSLRGLGNRLPEDSRSDLLRTIEEEAERLNRFVGNLLDMTRLEAGVLDVKRDWVDLRDVVRAAVDRARRVHPEHVFSTDMASDVPLVRLDPVLFEQVLVNLLDNAAKYAPPRTAVTVSARLAGSRPVVTVSDHGPGIDAQDLPHVFEKFYRARQGDRQPAGTGLGLAIVKGLVEAMGGEISIASPARGGPGTEVVITLEGAAGGPEMPDVRNAA